MAAKQQDRLSMNKNMQDYANYNAHVSEQRKVAVAAYSDRKMQ
jgi:hypothetical protein